MANEDDMDSGSEMGSGDLVKDTSGENKVKRTYRRGALQDFMYVFEVLQGQAPLPMSQKQIQEKTGLSKNKVFDICWNLVDRGWGEDVGGAIRLKQTNDNKEAYLGRMVARMVHELETTDMQP
ncbi:MAG: hypothetical protein KAR06_05650 [Deltaproteobacteria bacterium]|nr:hypothetical protein [Deltaproteobacteria bacterium]